MVFLELFCLRSVPQSARKNFHSPQKYTFYSQDAFPDT